MKKFRIVNHFLLNNYNNCVVNIKLFSFLSIILFLFVNTKSYSQKIKDFDYVDYFIEDTAPAKKDGKWGFVNIKGKTIVPPKYDFVFRFSEGLAQVVRNNKWGYVNIKGKEVIPLEYDYGDSFSEGLARVFKNGNYMFINIRNEIVISDNYLFVENFRNDLAIAVKKIQKDNYTGEYYDIMYGLINSKGDVVKRFEYRRLVYIGKSIYAYKNLHNVGLLHKTEDGLIEEPHDENSLEPYPFGIETYEDKILEKNFQDSKVAEKSLNEMEISFDEVFGIYEQVAVFTHNGDIGFINMHNQNVVQPKFLYAFMYIYNFKDGLLEVKIEDNYFFVDKTGEIVNINLMNYIELSEKHKDKYRADFYYRQDKRTHFNEITFNPPPPPPPSPSVIEYEEEIIEHVEEK